MAAPERTFPEERGHWFAGCIHQMRADPLGFYTRIHQQHGDYVRICAVPSRFCYVLTHPDAVEHVLLKAHKNYRKPDIFYNSVGLLVGDGLFTNEGDAWLKQRRLAQPAFHTQYLAQLTPQMVEAAEMFIKNNENHTGEIIDMVDGMMKVGLRIASTTLFSADISGEADAIGKAFRTTFRHVSNRLNSLQLIPPWLPTHANIRFRRAKNILDRAVIALINARRRNASKPNDLLTMLLGAHDQLTGESMPQKQLMDEVLTILTAGHENIGAALSWTWYLLARHPEIQENVHDEILAALGGRNPTFDDLPKLPLCKAVFEESMRIFPPGWGELRETIEPDEVNGYPLPAKSIIILCQWVTHRHKDFWPDPETFNPANFLGDAPANRHRFAYFPFGGGPRICIGMQFALIEGPIILATILQKFRVELVPDQQVVPDATFTLRPKYGLKVILHRR